MVSFSRSLFAKFHWKETRDIEKRPVILKRDPWYWKETRDVEIGGRDWMTLQMQSAVYVVCVCSWNLVRHVIYCGCTYIHWCVSLVLMYTVNTRGTRNIYCGCICIYIVNTRHTRDILWMYLYLYCEHSEDTWCAMDVHALVRLASVHTCCEHSWHTRYTVDVSVIIL